MRFFRSEYAHSYKTYTFGYSEYAIKEQGDSLSDLYELGYLPYSGAENTVDTLYMARSGRVNLKHLSLSSENRRIIRKFDNSFSKTKTSLSDFNTGEYFKKFCLTYFANRHGESVMPASRLETILNSGFITSVVTYYAQQNVVAYVLMVEDSTASHFWFSFYDLTYARQSLGLWLMLDCLLEAEKTGRKYFYVGTVYANKGMYKTSLPSLEYWHSDHWSIDIKHLRAMCRADAEHVFDILDRYKETLSAVFTSPLSSSPQES